MNSDFGYKHLVRLAWLIPLIIVVLVDTPILYYLVLSAVAMGGTSIVISVTILIQKLINKIKVAKLQK